MCICKFCESLWFYSHILGVWSPLNSPSPLSWLKKCNIPVLEYVIGLIICLGTIYNRVMLVCTITYVVFDYGIRLCAGNIISGISVCVNDGAFNRGSNTPACRKGRSNLKINSWDDVHRALGVKEVECQVRKACVWVKGTFWLNEQRPLLSVTFVMIMITRCKVSRGWNEMK